MASTLPEPASQPHSEYWAWALVPIIVLLAYNPPDIGWVRTGFGTLATVVLGVWMSRRFGRHGLVAFAVGCAIASLNLRYYPGGAEFSRGGWGWYQPMEDSVIALFIAWLAWDASRSPKSAILERAGVVRQWPVFWMLLILGLLAGSVYYAYGDPGESRLRLGPRFHGHEILVFLALLLGLANAGRKLLTALLLVLAVMLIGDIAHSMACEEDMLPDWACGRYYLNYRGDALDVGLGSAIHYRPAILQLAAFIVAYAVGRHVWRLERGEEERHVIWRSPGKIGLILLILGIGFGRYSFVELEEFELQIAGSYPLMLFGAFLLGSRLGYRGVAGAVIAYVAVAQIPALIEWDPTGDPFEPNLRMGGLLDCAIAALIGLGVRDRYRAPLDAPRPLETLTLFGAIWALLLGLVKLDSEAGVLWFMLVTLAAAFLVVGIRFQEERARSGHAVATLTDVTLLFAVVVFLAESVSGVIEAFGDVTAALGTFAAEVSGIGKLRLAVEYAPVQGWLFLLLLVLLVNIAGLYRRLRRMAQEGPVLLRSLLKLPIFAGREGPPRTPSSGTHGAAKED